jgi:AcrR family transcriptional regulator/RimJ/RimL family protein N-acetyltransferase
MSTQTLGWPTGNASAANSPAEGLRERKKRLMRQQLSDTATRMFLERGFDQVRVAEIAEACGVSEKTVFNYFPIKESLVLDRLESTVSSLRTGLADPERRPVQAALQILERELSGLTDWLASQEDPGQAAQAILRFGDLIRATPSLRAYQSDMMDQFVSVATQILAARAGMSPDDPEPQIAARALLGLWHVQANSLRTHLDGASAPKRVHDLVTADVRRAARLLATGLHSFPVLSVTSRSDRGVGPIALRPTVPGDSEFCYQLHKAAMGEYITAIWGWDEQVQRSFHDRAFTPGRWQIIAVGGADIGMIDIEYRPGEIYLARIEIHPDHQGHGVGTRLVSALIEEAEQAGQALVLDVLAVNPRAQALYQGLGLEEVARHGDNNIKITMRSARVRR